jgi:hypothetical protein
MRNLPFAKFAYLFNRCLLSCSQFDPGTDLFAIASIGYANNLYIADLGMRIQKLLYL